MTASGSLQAATPDSRMPSGASSARGVHRTFYAPLAEPESHRAVWSRRQGLSWRRILGLCLLVTALFWGSLHVAHVTPTTDVCLCLDGACAVLGVVLLVAPGRRL